RWPRKSVEGSVGENIRQRYEKECGSAWLLRTLEKGDSSLPGLGQCARERRLALCPRRAMVRENAAMAGRCNHITWPRRPDRRERCRRTCGARLQNQRCTSTAQ